MSFGTQYFFTITNKNCCDWYKIKIVLVVGPSENDVAQIRTCQLNKL